jgi:iron complex transport system ATP-binding protein
VTDLLLMDVAVELGGTRIVIDLDLAVTTGEWVALLGPNGAGKTTLLRAIAGLVPFTGRIRIGDVDPGTASRRRLSQLVAVVQQNPTIPSGMTVTDYVLLGRTPYIGYLGTESVDDLAIVRESMSRLDLERLATREVGSLSGGELQRTVLARALAQQAPVLLLDEPTSALDIGHVQQVLELVDGLRREDGLTVLSAMHDLTLAGRYADRMVLMACGEAVATGSADEVLTEAIIGRNYGAQVQVLHTDEGPVVVPSRAWPAHTDARPDTDARPSADPAVESR